MKTLFNDGWQFTKIHLESVDAPLPEESALLSIPDEQFTPVTIPHDWLIWNTHDLYENSIGIYRKNFLKNPASSASASSTSASTDRTLFRFEGVYMDTSVYINGEKAFEWKYGYTTFEVDATPFLKDGGNSITVISVYRSPNTRWYSGAGIYRDVWRIDVPDTHLVSDSVYFSSEKNADGSWSARISAEACWKPTVTGTAHQANPLLPDKQALVRFSLADEAGTVVAETSRPVTLTALATADPYWYLDPAGASVAEAVFHLKDVREWDVTAPHLYTLTTKLFECGGNTSAYDNASADKTSSACKACGRLLDSCVQKVGFRTIRFDSDEGFFLNGRHMKINGACMHHDLGALGAAFNLTALRRQFTKLRDMGVNAIRLSHNPPAPALMTLADEMGMLIDSECFDMWEKSKTTYDYARFFPDWHARDVASWIRRDRNHPSLIMWSIGNEIYDTHQGNGYAITKELTALVHRHDPAKNAPVTIASNYMEWQGAQSCAELVDIAGYNYGERLYQGHHVSHQNWRLYGSETSATVQSRGVYHFPADFRTLTHDDSQCSSLGNCSVNWGSANAADTVIHDRDAPFSAGQFIWTGWDYIGEPTPYFTKNSFFGQIDTAGFKKDTYFQYQAEWTDYRAHPMVHLLPYWDFNIGQLIDIRAYTNAPQVELLFNGSSCGVQRIDHAHGTKLAGEWQLPFTPGTIMAIARDESGAELARESRTTPGDPARLVVKLDKPHFEGPRDLIFAEIYAVDKAGNPVDNARNRVTVSVSGARLEGLDNGDSTDYEQYKTNTRRLFSNALIAILSPDAGNWDAPVTLTVTSPGLEGAQTGEVPVRKIELTCSGARALSPENSEDTVYARILPENATYHALKFEAVRLEGIASRAVTLTPLNVDSASVEPANSEKAGSAVSADAAVRVTARQDGEFRLRCSCDNGTGIPVIITELEFSVSGMGSTCLNPYEFISACEKSASLNECKLSFQGGVYVPEGRNWISFENVDFGTEGSDTFTIPIFSFDTTMTLGIWDGNPDNGGRLLMQAEYNSPSWYNHYQSNTWTLPRRLTGIHDLYILTDTNRFSIQGFQFERSQKAFSALSAPDADSITGDTFTRESDRISGIGNNVSLEFRDMDFGTDSVHGIRIKGRAVNGTNTVHILFMKDDAEPAEMRTAVEIPATEEVTEHSFGLDVPVHGKCRVVFVFLPGSCFDFEGFQFEK